MTEAVIYARVSSTGERQSTERQVADLKRYAAASGMDVVENGLWSGGTNIVPKGSTIRAGITVNGQHRGYLY